jgi:hypothetical protein
MASSRVYMKNILLLITFIFFAASCDNNSNPDFKDFQFLLGDWKRVNDQEGFNTFESWRISESGNYEGFGYTLQHQDTVFSEYMHIQWIDSAFYLVVEGVNEKPTHFYINEKSDGYLSCINEKNDFPKKISYRLQQEELVAIISDDNNEVIFTFQAQ